MSHGINYYSDVTYSIGEESQSNNNLSPGLKSVTNRAIKLVTILIVPFTFLLPIAYFALLPVSTMALYSTTNSSTSPSTDLYLVFPELNDENDEKDRKFIVENENAPGDLRTLDHVIYLVPSELVGKPFKLLSRPDRLQAVLVNDTLEQSKHVYKIDQKDAIDISNMNSIAFSWETVGYGLHLLIRHYAAKIKLVVATLALAFAILFFPLRLLRIWRGLIRALSRAPHL